MKAFSINFGKIFQCQYYNSHFWIRIFNKGFSIKNIVKNPLLFSQRYKIAHSKSLLVKNYYFELI